MIRVSVPYSTEQAAEEGFFMRTSVCTASPALGSPTSKMGTIDSSTGPRRLRLCHDLGPWSDPRGPPKGWTHQTNREAMIIQRAAGGLDTKRPHWRNKRRCSLVLALASGSSSNAGTLGRLDRA